MATGPGRSATRLLLGLYLLVIILGIVLHLVVPGQLPASVGLAAAMPVLGAVLISALPASRLRTWTLVAVAFAWFGDLSWLFVIKLAFFLVAQIAYVVAFWPYRGAVRRVPAAAYLAGIAPTLAVIAGDAQGLAGPVIAYGVSLAAMAVLAFGVNTRAGLGGLLFLLSDIELALAFFVLPGQIPYVGAINSALYLPGQGLIVLGVIARARADSAAKLSWMR